MAYDMTTLFGVDGMNSEFNEAAYEAIDDVTVDIINVIKSVETLTISHEQILVITKLEEASMWVNRIPVNVPTYPRKNEPTPDFDNEDVQKALVSVETDMLILLDKIDETIPMSRARTIALTKLEEAMHWICTAIKYDYEDDDYPTEENKEFSNKIDRIKDSLCSIAERLTANAPQCRELSMALTLIDEASLWLVEIPIME